MKTGLESLDTGASKITYSGNEGPKAPQETQQKMAEFELQEYMEEFERVFPEMKELRGTQEYMDNLQDYFQGLASKQNEGIGNLAMADPLLEEEYQKYVFEMEEQGLQPMSFQEFEAQARAGMNEGGIVMQGGVKNYLGKQKTVSNVPVKWQSGPDKPDTELAYITKAEKDLLLKEDIHGSLQDGPNTGPGGIMSLDSQGDFTRDRRSPQSKRSGTTGPGNQGNFREAAQHTYSAPAAAQVRASGPTYSVATRGDGTPFVGGAGSGGADDPDDVVQQKDTKPVSNFFDARKKAAYNASLIIPGQTERIAKYRKAYKEYLESMGITPPSSLDDEDLYEFFKSDAFNYEPGAADAGMPEAMNYGDFLLEEFNNPTVKYRGDMGAYKREMGLGGDGPGITSQYPYPYPINTAVSPAVAGTGTTNTVAAATGNPFLPGGNLPFANYGTAAHGTQFGVDQRMFAADGGRIGYAGGGITGLRQGYFLGKLVKKIGRGIKKVVKSPIGKLALIGGLGAFGINKFGTGATFMDKLRNVGAKAFLKKGMTKFTKENISPFKMFSGITALSSLPLLFGQSQEDEEEGINYADLPNIFDKYSPTQLRERVLQGKTTRAENPFLPPSYYAADGGRIGLMDGGDLRAAALTEMYNDDEEDKKLLAFGGSAGLPPVTAGIEGQASQSFSDDETPAPTQQDQMPRPMPNPMMMANRMNPMMMANRMNPMMARGMMPRTMAQGGRIGYQDGGNVFELLQKELEGTITPEELELLEKLIKERGSLPFAQGGRIGAQEGGLMDLGGMEKDYRNDGGFVPIGGQERADDVPARLSKNEFVFTADAVRAAGSGNIDKGAEVMENMMENLEKGGKVSEESQGLKGARDMFATAQRLEGVL